MGDIDFKAERKPDISRVAGVIFDLDGVLIDSEPIHCSAWLEAAKSFNIKPPATFPQDIVGMSDSRIAEMLAASPCAACVRELIALKREIFHRTVAAGKICVDDLKDSLWRLKVRGVPFTIATSSSKAEAFFMLRSGGLDSFFEDFIALDDVARPKPDPEAYLKASALLGLQSYECAALEDSAHGIRAASDAGCIPLAVGIGNFPEAFKSFGNVVEAIAWIENIVLIR